MPSKRSLYEALERSMNIIGAQLHVCLPGRVERYDHTQQRADVVPLLRERYADGQVTEAQVITNVPIVFPRSGGASLTMPVNRGDGVMLHFTDRSLDEWLGNGGTVTPSDPRSHDLSDCIAVPGLYSFSDQSPQDNNSDTLLQFEGSQVRLTGGGDIEISTGGNVTVNAGGSAEVTASDATVNADTVVNGNVLINGSLTWTGTATGADGGPAQFGSDVESNGISLNNHTHGGVEPGSGSTGGPE